MLLQVFGSKSTIIVVLVSVLVMVSTVWSVSCLLFFYSQGRGAPPNAQPFVKVVTCGPAPYVVGVTAYDCKPKFNLACHVTFRHYKWNLDSTCRACRNERVDQCCSTSSTQPTCMGSTRRTCRVMSRRDVTNQVEFGLCIQGTWPNKVSHYHESSLNRIQPYH